MKVAAYENRPRKKKRRRRRRGRISRLLSLFVICGALFFGTSIFFKVTVIQMEGSAYSAEQVIAASGIREGDNLLFISGGSAEENIIRALPYVDKVQVSKYYPNRIVLTVEDSYPIAFAECDGRYVIMDKHCKVLEVVTDLSGWDLIVVSGIVPIQPTEGERLALGEAGAGKVDYLEALLCALTERDMQADVSAVDLTDGGNLKFDYMQGYTVELGANEALEKKFRNLFIALENTSDIYVRIIVGTEDNVARVVRK